MNLKWTPMDAINSEAKLRLLAYLFGRAPASMSATEIAKIIDLSSMTVARLLKELENNRVVNIKRVGSAYVCSLNPKSFSCQVLRSIFKRIGSIPTPLEHLKRTVIKTLPLDEIESIYIYGSVAKNESTAESDIDLLIVEKRATKESSDKISSALDRLNIKCLDLYGMRLEGRIISKKDVSGAKSKEFINSGISIFP